MIEVPAMRFLKIAIAGLITIAAMLASLLMAFGVALIGALVYLYLRLRGRSTPAVSRSPAAPARPAASEVIEVTATEVRTKTLDP